MDFDPNLELQIFLDNFNKFSQRRFNKLKHQLFYQGCNSLREFCDKSENIFFLKEHCEENCVFAEVYFLTKIFPKLNYLAIFYTNVHLCSSRTFHITGTKREIKFSRKIMARGTCRFMRPQNHANFIERKILRKLFKYDNTVPMSNLQNKVLKKFFIFRLTHCLKSAGAFCLKVVAREIGGTTAILNKKYLLEGSVHTMRNKESQ
jgi:hypothetical protein